MLAAKCLRINGLLTFKLPLYFKFAFSSSKAIPRLRTNFQKTGRSSSVTFLSRAKIAGAEDDFIFHDLGTKIPQPVCEDDPIDLPSNPFEKKPRKCILCRHKITLDYKNPRLLQQFVSSFSGRIYDRHVTGLCDKQHDILIRTIAMSRKAGYMPIFTKDPKFLNDPKLFDPLRPIRQHSFA